MNRIALILSCRSTCLSLGKVSFWGKRNGNGEESRFEALTNAPATNAELNDSLHVQNKYLMARCCLALGNLREAEAALVQGTPLGTLGPQKCLNNLLQDCQVPNGASGLYLLGVICEADNRREHAITYFALALKLDPFLWDAYERLCKLGVDVPPETFFGFCPLRFDLEGQVCVINCTPHSENQQIESKNESASSTREPRKRLPGFQDTIPVPPKSIRSRHSADSIGMNRVGEARHESFLARGRGRAQGQGLPVSITMHSPETLPWLKSSRNDAVGEVVITQSDLKVVKFLDDGVNCQLPLYLARPEPPTAPLEGSQMRPTRRSARRAALRENSNDSAEVMDLENSQSGTNTAHGAGERSPSPAKDEGNRKDELESPEGKYLSGQHRSKKLLSIDDLVGSVMLLNLLRLLGEGTRLLHQYHCSEAVEAFSKLPFEQQQTGWVLQQRGRACFEMADYRQGKEEFERMREVAPERSAGLEFFSTNLWHLKEEVSLCYLAQQALELNKKSPEAWCVVGNCFSLQKEHDVAIKFFQRALQLDPMFTYAYTLSGHEYVSNEDFEKAVACYRHAIRTDSRHYNAWYGLGTIYYRQEKYDLAEYHFRRALSINPRSSVLYCYLGMVLHANQKFDEALKMLKKASELDPANPQAKYQRALVLKTLDCHDAALEELEAVRDFAPRESSVHFLMGKICKQLGRRDEAMLHFTTALDLDPKDANMIKVAMERIDQPDMDETEDL